MKIFITGATGFIGKHLVEKLISEGHQVTVNLYGNESSPFKPMVLNYSLNESKPDEDIHFLKSEMFDGIIHLASLYLTDHKAEDVVRLVDSNVRFSSYVLECAAHARVKWFINTGTFWQHYQNAQYSPVNLYAATKQAFESIAQYYVETNQILFCTLKLSDTFGPNDTRPKIFNLWERIAKSGETLGMSPGDQLIDITYIDDIVMAFSQLANQLNNNLSEIKNGDYFAVKAIKRFSLKELAKLYEGVIGRKLNIQWGARPYREREVMVPWEDGKTVPGWKPMLDLIESIKRANLLNGNGSLKK